MSDSLSNRPSGVEVLGGAYYVDVLSTHRFQWTARRARRRWMRSVRGRDAYVYRRGFMRYEVSYIDYKRPRGLMT